MAEDNSVPTLLHSSDAMSSPFQCHFVPILSRLHRARLRLRLQHCRKGIGISQAIIGIYGRKSKKKRPRLRPKKEAGVLGFEPRQTDPESVVLPLHYTPKFQVPSGARPWRQPACILENVAGTANGGDIDLSATAGHPSWANATVLRGSLRFRNRSSIHATTVSQLQENLHATHVLHAELGLFSSRFS